MEERIDIAELLEDCPQDMELDCTMMDNVVFEKIDISNYQYPIVIRNSYNFKMNLTRYGQYSEEEDYKCIIFPKGKRTWEGFTPPCKFKDGDVLIKAQSNTLCIYKSIQNKNCIDFYCGCSPLDNEIIIKKDKDEHFGLVSHAKLATEEEKARLFQVIKDNGYQWNSKTKTLEKIVVPEFKDGDVIYVEGFRKWVAIVKICDDNAVYEHVALQINDGTLEFSNNIPLFRYGEDTPTEIRFATEEEKQKLFQAIKDNGYEWKSETKTLERLVVPKFKVGDTVRHEEDKTVIIIIEIKDDYYVMQSYDQYSSGGYQYTKIPIKDQDQYKLFNFHDKLDISTLEKIEPKFKVWDKIRLKNDKNTIETINYIYSGSYGLCSHHMLYFKEQDEWELVPDKFDVTTLKPFDKVLGRTDNTGIWECDLFSCYNDSELYNNFHCIGVNYRYCIPYEGNEHLLGKTDDCDDFYKTWEE